MGIEYHRLGDYIREVNVRNRDLKVTNLLGLSIEKKFIPSIANTIGTDMSTYKIVHPSQFAYVPVTSRNGEKITIALYENEDDAIISQAYTIFEIVPVETHGRASLQTNELLPEYLMMWFRRPEFDRYARCHSHGSAREVFDWNELCDVRLPIPSIARQREIVAEYETLANRIRINGQMIAKLEETAQALYRKMFVETKTRTGYFTDVVKLSGGGTPDTSEASYWNGNIPFFTPADKGTMCYCIETEKHLTQKGLNNCSSKLYSKDTTFVTARGTVGELSLAGMDMAMNQSCYALLPRLVQAPFFIYHFAKDAIESLKQGAVGAVFNALVTRDFETKEMQIPSEEVMLKYNELAKPIFRSVYLRQQENLKLTELQSLLLARMGR